MKVTQLCLRIQQMFFNDNLKSFCSSCTLQFSHLGLLYENNQCRYFLKRRVFQRLGRSNDNKNTLARKEVARRVET